MAPPCIRMVYGQIIPFPYREALQIYAVLAAMLRAREERLDLIFLDRTRRREATESLRLRLLPSTSLYESLSLKSPPKMEFQESVLRTDSESESSFTSHWMMGNALEVSSKIRFIREQESLESTLLMLPRLLSWLTSSSA